MRDGRQTREGTRGELNSYESLPAVSEATLLWKSLKTDNERLGFKDAINGAILAYSIFKLERELEPFTRPVLELEPINVDTSKPENISGATRSKILNNELERERFELALRVYTVSVNDPRAMYLFLEHRKLQDEQNDINARFILAHNKGAFPGYSKVNEKIELIYQKYPEIFRDISNREARLYVYKLMAEETYQEKEKK
jgi:hypothetical protein